MHNFPLKCPQQPILFILVDYRPLLDLTCSRRSGQVRIELRAYSGPR